MDDLVAAATLDQRAAGRVDVERMGGGPRGSLAESVHARSPTCDAPPVNIDLDALFRPERARASGWRRMPAIAAEAMVATSHPLGDPRRPARPRARRERRRRGARRGRHADRRRADRQRRRRRRVRARLGRTARCTGSTARAARPPSSAGGRRTDDGPCSVTVPGAVRLWADLAARFGRFGLDAARRPARPTRRATARVHARGSPTSGRRAELAPVAGAGDAASATGCPSSRATLRRIAADGPDALYDGRGRGGDRGGLLALGGRSRRPSLRVGRAAPPRLPRRRGLRAAAERPGRGRAARARPLRRARAGAALGDRGDEARLRRRARGRARRPAAGRLLRRGAARRAPCARAAGRGRRRLGFGAAARRDDVPLCRRRGRDGRLADPEPLRAGSARASSRPGTGVVLQNRGAGFSREPGHPNALAPAKRPFHTIIPGMLLEDGELLGPFGVMGGPMQPQGHFQVVRRLVDDGDDPQAALDAPRWRVEEDGVVELEPGLAAPRARPAGAGPRRPRRRRPAPVRGRSDDPAPRGRADRRLGRSRRRVRRGPLSDVRGRAGVAAGAAVEPPVTAVQCRCRDDSRPHRRRPRRRADRPPAAARPRGRHRGRRRGRRRRRRRPRGAAREARRRPARRRHARSHRHRGLRGGGRGVEGAGC